MKETDKKVGAKSEKVKAPSATHHEVNHLSLFSGHKKCKVCVSMCVCTQNIGEKNASKSPYRIMYTKKPLTEVIVGTGD